MFGWRIERVVGDSMRPTLESGDFVIARERDLVSVGSVVLVSHETFGPIVKRVRAREGDGRLCLAGDDRASVDSTVLGSVPPAAIRGVVRWRVSPSGVHRLRSSARRRLGQR